MRCARRLEVVPGATHLFEEAGALDQVAILAARQSRGHCLRAQLRVEPCDIVRVQINLAL